MRKKNIIFILYICIIFCFDACKEKKLEVRYHYPAFIDTLTTLNSLFTKKEIELKMPEDMFLPQLFNYCTKDVQGNIYVIGRDFTIYKFSEEGNYLNKLSRIGRGEGEYLATGTIVLDDSLNLYLDNYRGQNIIKYDKDFNFIKEFRVNSISQISSMLIKDNKIFCLLPLDPVSALKIYDINTGNKVNEYEITDDLFTKHGSIWGQGALSMDFEEKEIYFMLTHTPDINIISLAEDDLKKIPLKLNSFKKISSSPPVSNNILHYSVITGLYVEKDFLIISYLSPEKERNYEKDPRRFAIVDMQGNILKENMTFNTEGALFQYSPGNFISTGKIIKDKRNRNEFITKVNLYSINTPEK